MIEVKPSGYYDEAYETIGKIGPREAGLIAWRERKEERDFGRLCRRISWNNFAKRRWRKMTPEQRAAVYAYRKGWADAHRDVIRTKARAKHKRERANKKFRDAENAEKRARRAVETQKRRESTVYTCQWCGSQWSPIGRLPAHPPLYCCHNHGAKARYHAKRMTTQEAA